MPRERTIRAPYVRDFLDTSQDQEIFVLGVESWEDPYDPSSDDEATNSEPRRSVDTSGKTTLHTAACEAYPEMVELLITRGADVNATDLDGRTPLMEAALWGRVENAKLLLQHGAQKHLPCIENDRIHRAVDFAKRTKRNAASRWARSGRDTNYTRRTRMRETRIETPLSISLKTQSARRLIPGLTNTAFSNQGIVHRCLSSLITAYPGRESL